MSKLPKKFWQQENELKVNLKELQKSEESFQQILVEIVEGFQDHGNTVSFLNKIALKLNEFESKVWRVEYNIGQLVGAVEKDAHADSPEHKSGECWHFQDVPKKDGICGCCGEPTHGGDCFNGDGPW